MKQRKKTLLNPAILSRVPKIVKRSKPKLSIGPFVILKKVMYTFNGLWVDKEVAKGYMWACKASLEDLRRFNKSSDDSEKFKRGVRWFIREYDDIAAARNCIQITTII